MTEGAKGRVRWRQVTEGAKGRVRLGWEEGDIDECERILCGHR